MKKIFPLVFFLLFLFLGLKLGNLVGAGQKTVQVQDTFQATQAALPIENDRILFVGVDHLESEETIVLSVWLVSRGNTPNTFFAAPIYPTDSDFLIINEDILVNPKDFSAIQNLSIIQDKRPLPWIGIVVLDRTGFAVLMSMVQGKDTIDNSFEQVIAMTLPAKDPLVAFSEQRNYLQVIYRNMQDNINAQSYFEITEYLIEMEDDHFYTNLSNSLLVQEAQALIGGKITIHFVNDVQSIP